MTDFDKTTPDNCDEVEVRIPFKDSDDGNEKDEENQIVPREKWSTKFDFILSCVGLCIGLGNVWRFPYLCYENGGGSFLIPYLITLVIAGIPMLMLELSLGQMFNVGGLGVWKSCPIFKGVGYAATIMAFWLNVYYIVIVAYAFFYLGNTFTLGDLPWKRCSEDWNTKCCKSDYNSEDSFTCQLANISFSPANYTALYVSSERLPVNYSLPKVVSMNHNTIDNKTASCLACGKAKWNSPVSEFWERKALDLSKGIEEPGILKWQLVVCLGIAWIICYFCIWKGVKWTGKIVYVTALFPYMLLFILLIRGVTLDGASEGIEYYLKANFTKMQDSKVWMAAASQIFFSLGLGLGTHIALGSYNPLTNNCFKDAFIVGTINSTTSIFAGFVIFSVIGYMAKAQKKHVSQVAASGPGLAFLVYPSGLSEMPGSHVWTILFFLMIFFVGIDSQFCTVEGFITAILDEWPKLRRHRELFVLVTCIMSFLIALSTVTQGGMYVFKMFDHYSASGPALLTLIFFECIAFSWAFGKLIINKLNTYDNYMLCVVGIKRLSKKMKQTTGTTPMLFWQFCWVILCPIACVGILIFAIATFEPLEYTRSTYPKYQYPDWGQAIGIMIALSSIICIPVYATYYTIKVLVLDDNKDGLSVKKRIINMFRPEIPEIDRAVLANQQLQMNPMAASL